MPVRDYTYREFNTTMKEVLEYHLATMKGKLRVNFFTVDAEDLDGVIHILEKIGFNVEQHGEILFLNHAYNRYGRRMKSVQYAYFYNPDPVLAVFAFKGIDYYNSPLVRAAEKEREIAHLRFFPKTLNGLIEKTLSFEDAHIVEFKGEKVKASRGAGEKRSGVQKMKITYEALDGDLALAEMKYKYDISQSQKVVKMTVLQHRG